MKFLQENAQVNLSDFGLSNDFPDTTTNIQMIKQKTEKLDLIKI